MIELSNSNALVLAPGQSATFDTVILHTGCAESHRINSGSVNLTRKNAVYEVSYNVNIGATEAETEAQVALSLDGAALPETTQKVMTAAAGDLQGVSASTFVSTGTPCCYFVASALTFTNTGTSTINLDANPRFSVKRVA